MNPLALFDLDGTLVDTSRAIVQTFEATVADLGLQPVCDEAIGDTIGMPLARAFAKLLAVHIEDALVAEAVRRYRSLSQAILLPRARALVFPGVAEGLARLTAHGIMLGVATSRTQASAEALLEAAGLDGHFAAVVGADRVSRPKPYPESGHLAMALVGADAASTVVIGDTTDDLLMARAAGMRSLAVTYGVHDRAELARADPDFIADDPRSAAAILEGALARRVRRRSHLRLAVG